MLPSFNKLDYPMVQIPQNGIVPVPQLRIPQYIAGYAPYISSAIINHIQTHAQASPLRLVTFNELAQNGYGNQEYTSTLELCCNYVHYCLVQGRVASIDRAIAEIVPHFTNMAVAHRIKKYAMQLHAAMPPNQVNSAFEQATNYERITGEVAAFIQAGGLNQMPQRTATLQQQVPAMVMMPQQMQAMMPGVAQQQSGIHAMVQNATQQYQQNINPRTGRGTGSLFPTGGYGEVVPQNTQTDMPETMAGVANIYESFSLAPAGSNKEQPAPAYVQYAPVPNVEHTYIEEDAFTMDECDYIECSPDAVTKDEWEPSEEQPYLTLYNPITSTAEYIRQPDGSVLQFIKELTMEQANHQLPGVNVSERIARENEEAERIRSAMGNLASSAKLPEPPKDETVLEEAERIMASGIEYKNVILESTLRSALLIGQTHKLEFCKEWASPMIFTYETLVAESIPARESYNDLLEAISIAGDYVSAAKILVAAKDSTPAAIWNYINELLTLSVNKALAVACALGDSVSFDDFATDMEDMVAYLEGPDFSAAISASLKANAPNVLKRIFVKLTEDELKAALSDFTDGVTFKYGEGTTPEFTTLARRYSVALVNLPSDELGINRPISPRGEKITDATPLLYTLASELFQRSGKKGHSHILIQTTDGICFEIMQGYFGVKTYLVTEFRP